MAAISQARGAEPPLADSSLGRLTARVGMSMARPGRYDDMGGATGRTSSPASTSAGAEARS
jgi:hypothetical protein